MFNIFTTRDAAMFKASHVLSLHNTLSQAELKQTIYDNYLVDEAAYLEELLSFAHTDERTRAHITNHATSLVKNVREGGHANEGVEAFLQQYSLDTHEGVVLMCLAEALLRIPDAEVANKFIKDKLTSAHWETYVGKSNSWLVNASTWGLMLTGGIVNLDEETQGKPAHVLGHVITRCGEPVIRTAMSQAMKLMGHQFVLGQTIDDALKQAKTGMEKGYTHSFDMLGEAALTHDDALFYFRAYSRAIDALGAVSVPEDLPLPSISIKLSALHPRYESTHESRVLKELGDRVLALIKQARQLNVPITIDAEEMDRLDLSLTLFEQLLRDDVCKDWHHLGLAIQAYSKRTLPALAWLRNLGQELGRQIPVRLVKGAYWDSEIKWAQQKGLSGYPVFTRKAATDVSYLACARYLLAAGDVFYPQFATHNAQTVAAILVMAGENNRAFEFQRLHGMGEALYSTVLAEDKRINCRIYAPVGAHCDLLPYLVRRLLENGANTSFVHLLVDDNTPIENLVTDPLTILRDYKSLANTQIPLPPALYGTQRCNSRGANLFTHNEQQQFMQDLAAFKGKTWQASSSIAGAAIMAEKKRIIQAPYNTQLTVGTVYEANIEHVALALDQAEKACDTWMNTAVETRAECIEHFADLLEQKRMEFIALCAYEGGKTLQDGIDEIREAVDFCRYYALQARRIMHEGYHQGRGIFVCISPWNFPLAIFTGQIVAALAAGNSVIAKPAEQTCLIAHRAVELLHQAGIPTNVLQLLLGSGADIGAALTADSRVAGVAFTGSTITAQHINRSLAKNAQNNVPLIAETGGQNAMIVDSSALPEQVVNDVIHSAFTSAGQRCSALRVLYLQEDIAPRVLELLKGAMQELVIGDPTQLNTDVSAVIDQRAAEDLHQHINTLRDQSRLIYQAATTDVQQQGYFVPPTALRIDNIHDLEKEYFGPVLHVITYKAKELKQIIDSINNYGYGLTLGVHSRNEKTAFMIEEQAQVGNCYINRDMIGATVGVQPFGGQGLSGTGPKAGGEHYLHRFMAVKKPTTSIYTDTAPLLHHIIDNAQHYAGKPWQQAELGVDVLGIYRVHSDHEVMGTLINYTEKSLDTQLAALKHTASEWQASSVKQRTALLAHCADVLLAEAAFLAMLCHEETGIPLEQAAKELYSAITYCRSLADYVKQNYAQAQLLQGVTGESNELYLQGRGLVACLIQHADQPVMTLAQATLSALAMGNTVAITSSACPLLTHAFIEIINRVGLPVAAFHSDKIEVGQRLAYDSRIVAVVFEGDTEAACEMKRSLVSRDGLLVPLLTQTATINHFDDTLYLLAHERTRTNNTAALGGNAQLLALG